MAVPTDPRFHAGVHARPAVDTGWHEAAICRRAANKDVFFPDKGSSARIAKQFCRVCPVALACLEYAIANDEKFGIWGGLSERERRKLKRQRREQREAIAS